MCGRFGQLDKDSLAEAYHVDASTVDAFDPNYNTDVGSYALIVRNDKPGELQYAVFGLTPFWADKPKYVFNARAEGDFNKANDPAYNGEKGLFKKPFFRHLKRKRCILPVHYFLEGPEKERLKKPYIVERKDQKPFALGGLWDEWTDKDSGEILPSFTIITTPNNELLGRVGHHRSPLLIPDDQVSDWLDPERDRASTEAFLQPFSPDGFHAFRVDPEIRRKNDKGQNNSPLLTQQVGEELGVNSKE
ncbi:MAG: SOS response-associated peptidase [Flavobacteriales bacterium]